MTTYVNDHGQEPSPAAPPEFGTPSPDLPPSFRGSRETNMVVVRTGREGIDDVRCQAPTKAVPMGSQSVMTRCDRPATCVVVENKPRPDGTIGGMGLCDQCYYVMTINRPLDYAKKTTIAQG